MKRALIIIDMQVASFGPDNPSFDEDGLIKRVNKLAEKVRATGDTVIFVQHDGPDGNVHHPSQTGWQLLKGLDVQPQDKIIRKSSCDAFLDTELSAIIASEAINQLIITGCVTEYCVDTTIRSALARGFKTFAPADGHTTSDRHELTAEQIILHHNMVWQTFGSPVGGADIRKCAEIEH